MWFRHLLFISFHIIFGCLPNLALAQEELTVSYTHAIRGFELTTNLYINSSAFLYQRFQENDERTNDGGIEFYLHKEYFEWYCLRNRQLIETRRETSKYIFNASWNMNELSWNIHDEFKKIHGYSVQKATLKPIKRLTYYLSSGEKMSFDDELAVAWFSVELPYNAGPEGYYGLPGLILRLEFTERAESIEVKKVNFVNVKIVPPVKDGIKVTKDEFFNFRLIDKKWLKKQIKLYKQKKKNRN